MLVLEFLKAAAEKYLIRKRILRDENDLQAIASEGEFPLLSGSLISCGWILVGSELPTSLTRVVIGVPHTFTKNQRNATIRAAERAGFTEVGSSLQHNFLILLTGPSAR